MTTDVLRVSEPRDLLSVVPFQLGFTPTHSLVLMSLRGARRRVGLVLRVDLPPPGDDWPDALLERVVHHVVADDATAAVAAVYSDHHDPHRDAPSVVTGAQEVTERLHGAGVTVVDAWHVGPTRYRSLMCEEVCCPYDGWPVELLASSRLGAEMVYRGLTATGSRADLVGDLTPAPGEVRAAVAAAGADSAAVATTDPAGWRSEVLAAWRLALVRPPGAGAPGWAPVAGTLLAGLADLVVRDAVMLSCVPGAGAAADELVTTGAPGRRAVQALDGVFSPAGATRPDPDRLEQASDLLRALARCATGAAAAPPLGLLAWAAWWSGDGARAGDFADLALEADPAHSLASLLRECVHRGVAPGWAARDRLDDLSGRPRAQGGRRGDPPSVG